MREASVVGALRALDLAGRIAHVERLPARPARPGALDQPVRGPARDLVSGVTLWHHQAEAIDAVRAGRSIALATGTASGKSLAYQVPVVESVTDPVRPGTALLLFPTKALAHDQLRALVDVDGVVACAYDGDAGRDERAFARRHANVLLTNPEMLHYAMLPHHARWATFFMRLRHVVVDELHVLRGVFGTQVSHVLRRLARTCALYGADPTFVFLSATVGEPARLASDLCGRHVDAVTDDGSPRGERFIALVDPAGSPPTGDAGRADNTARRVSSRVLAGLVDAGHRGIAFTQSRTGAELLAAGARRHADPGRTIEAYRGGYLASERRSIEARLSSGELDAVVGTSALELGIDIGGLDACVLDGFPGTIAAMWQRIGRIGRHNQASLAVLVAGADQLDRWLLAHPTELFSRPPEPAVVNPANPFVLDRHLGAAAFETALSPADERWWGDDLDDGVRRLVRSDQMRIRRGRAPSAHWIGAGFPAQAIGLRSSSGGMTRIEDADGALVGTVDDARTHELLHPGASYLHAGRHWEVTNLDLDRRVARVVPSDGRTYTVARSDTWWTVAVAERIRAVGRATLVLGEIEVTSRVTGYRRRSVASGDVIATRPLDLPPTTLRTRGFWYLFDDDVLADADLDGDPERAASALHAAEHAAIGMLPLFAICDRWDVGGVSVLAHPDTGLATVVVYDGYAGGAGVAELGFDAADRHLAATLEVIEACDCAVGCPSCVQSPKCGNWNEHLDKAAARSLLRTTFDLAPRNAATRLRARVT